MRIISTLHFIIVLVFLGYPYTQIYFLNEAAKNNDHTELANLVNLETVKDNHKHALEYSVKNNVDMNATPNILSDIMTEGAGLAGTVMASTINYDWISQHLQGENGRTLIQDMTFAFFESPTRFTIRIRELRENPIHIQMELKDWKWQVVGIYE